jgi:hypothetical protein
LLAPSHEHSALIACCTAQRAGSQSTCAAAAIGNAADSPYAARAITGILVIRNLVMRSSFVLRFGLTGGTAAVTTRRIAVVAGVAAAGHVGRVQSGRAGEEPDEDSRDPEASEMIHASPLGLGRRRTAKSVECQRENVITRSSLRAPP